MPISILPSRVSDFCKSFLATDHACIKQKTSGVYVILNKVAMKFYIGTTSNLSRRFASHRIDLLRGRHPNSKLQSDWDIYGEHAFAFAVFAMLDVASSNALEKELIAESLGDSCYNFKVTMGMGRPVLAKGEACDKMSMLRLTDPEYAMFKTLGGVKWLRSRLDLAIEQNKGK